MERARSLTIASLLAPPLVIAGGWVIFYVLKEPPFVRDRCMGAHPADIEAYRDWLGTYATASAAVIAAVLLRISRRPATLATLGACAGLALLYNLDDGAFVVHAPPAFGLLVVGGEVLLLVTAALAITRRSRLALLTNLWTWLLVGLPALAGFPASEGTPGLCL